MNVQSIYYKVYIIGENDNRHISIYNIMVTLPNESW